jgi:tetratricopeptide (TPR) repeat protein
MNNPAYSALDQTELLQLAFNAGTHGTTGDAIAYLKEAAGRSDATAIAHYLLGAEYAQNGLYERAVDEMEAAIAIDPALSIARLQLGLLLTTMNDIGKARLILQPLQDIDAGDALGRFAAGLVFLFDGRLREARECLEQGIDINRQNPPLNVDMRRLADEIDRALVQGGAVEEQGGVDEQEPDSGLHVLLSAYMGNKAS